MVSDTTLPLPEVECPLHSKKSPSPYALPHQWHDGSTDHRKSVPHDPLDQHPVLSTALLAKCKGTHWSNASSHLRATDAAFVVEEFSAQPPFPADTTQSRDGSTNKLSLDEGTKLGWHKGLLGIQRPQRYSQGRPPEKVLDELQSKLRRSRDLQHPQRLGRLGCLRRAKLERQLRPSRNSQFRPPESSPATFCISEVFVLAFMEAQLLWWDVSGRRAL
ncbi:hypothetical protein HPB50_001298 [Hyalomma asiaticum]|uniref:Uncharacterized protein n=1 Tax=Hyalomma asiaticum TaxID=266040 RepID=A0ACB7RKP3_HYAAI|nr:hypothetical protein HPB50_001298 [Hyalomma asiaticum]